jgi:tRNA (mo5U34)-methyltransferase
VFRSKARRERAARDARRAELEQLALSQDGHWWHSIDFGEGVVTRGAKSPEYLAHEWQSLQLPDLHGKSVLDIGAWDGFYSFECERRGAKRVVALDHYIWSIDIDAQHRYHDESGARGEAPRPYDEVPEVWKPDTLPGKAGFDTAHRALDSKVESVVGDFMTMDLEPLGTFDVVLYLGVLYHIKDPFTALRRLAQVTKGMAVIETEAIIVPGFEDHQLWEFFEKDELNTDPTNWWAPNLAGLVGMCRSAGFRDVVTDVDLDAHARMDPGQLHRYRTIVRAWA